MALWVNRTVLSGSSTAANGTASHTCTFTAAATGNYLVAIVGGSMTFSTPAGWTLLISCVNNAGLYVFTKTALSGESSFTTTHNGSNYVMAGVVYEYYAGTTSLGGGSKTTSSSSNGPTVSGLSGIYSRFGARSYNISSTQTTSVNWLTPTIEDYDICVPKGANDGTELSIAYDDNASGSSFTAYSDLMLNGGSSANSEGIAFALSVIAPPVTVVPFNWMTLG